MPVIAWTLLACVLCVSHFGVVIEAQTTSAPCHASSWRPKVKHSSSHIENLDATSICIIMAKGNQMAKLGISGVGNIFLPQGEGSEYL